MKKILFLLSVVAFAFFLCSSAWSDEKKRVDGSGRLEAEQREVDDFIGLEVSRTVRATLIQGEPCALVITADDNILPYVRTAVADGKLSVTISDEINVANATVDITITVPRLLTIGVHSGSVVEALSGWKAADSMVMAVSSGGRIKLNVKAPALELKVLSGGQIVLDADAAGINATASSGGMADLSGVVADLTLMVIAGASVTGEKLKADRASVTVNTSGKVDVAVRKELSYSISNGGQLTYAGSPAIKRAEVGSGGSVNTR